MTRTPQVVITPGLADITAPAITISAPLDGATYTQGQVVSASYSCADPDDSVTLCAGPVASAGLIDTRTAGRHSFTVNASDHALNRSSRTVTYTVKARTPPRASLGHIAVSAKGATVTLTCHGAAGQICRGTATLSSRERFRGTKLIGLSARKKKHVTSRRVTDARASYRTRAGGHTKITLTLNAAARRLLKRFGRLPAAFVLNGKPVRTVTFKVKPKTKRR